MDVFGYQEPVPEYLLYLEPQFIEIKCKYQTPIGQTYLERSDFSVFCKDFLQVIFSPFFWKVLDKNVGESSVSFAQFFVAISPRNELSNEHLQS